LGPHVFKMMKPLLIVNGTVVSAGSSRTEDIAISGGKIEKTGTLDSSDFPGYEKMDASGMLVFPGGIDPHVHFSLPTPAGPSSDDFASGSRAAIAGGTTTFIDFVTPVKGQSLCDALHVRKKEAEQSLIDYTLHMGISEWNNNVAKEIGKIIAKEKVSSFKAYLAYKESIGISIDSLEQLMKIVGPAGGIVLVHCEDGDMISRLQQEFVTSGKTGPEFHPQSRPEEAEILAVEKVIGLSGKTGCPVYIVHTSTSKAAEAIRQAKASGLKVYGETCPQYLLLDESVYWSGKEKGNALPYIISPPIRSKHNQDGLWKGLADGTFDAIATDHCPFNLKGQKDRGLHDFTKIPSGAGGIEHRLPLLYTYGVSAQRITLQQFVYLTSERPAGIFGFGSRKGKIEAGYDADLVIWDTEKESTISVQTHFQRCDSDIYDGFKVKGKPAKVIVNGAVAFSENKISDVPLKGRFLSR
jgi:dihydropyrimidinase